MTIEKGQSVITNIKASKVNLTRKKELIARMVATLSQSNSASDINSLIDELKLEEFDVQHI